MKNYFHTLLIFASLHIYAQDEIIFNIAYKPKTLYTLSSKAETTSIFEYEKSPEMESRLKQQGIENPEIKSDSSTINSIRKTGDLINNVFPLTVNYVKRDGQILETDGAILYAMVAVGEKPKFISIYSPDLHDDEKLRLFPRLKNGIYSELFPAQKVKVGETIMQEMPIQIFEGNIEFNLKNTFFFTLQRIEDNLAYFTVHKVYTFTSPDYSMKNNKATGTADGEMIYDIKNNFYLFYKMCTDDKNMTNEYGYNLITTTRETVTRRCEMLQLN